MALDTKKTGFLRRLRGYEAFKGLILGENEIAADLSFTFAESATQYGTTCKIQVTNSEGRAIAGVFNLRVWTSDSAAGVGVAATDPNGTVAAKSASGTVLGILTAKKAFDVITLADGSFTLELLDDSTQVLLYIAACIPSLGLAAVSRKTVSGDYKA